MNQTVASSFDRQRAEPPMYRHGERVFYFMGYDRDSVQVIRIVESSIPDLSKEWELIEDVPAIGPVTPKLKKR